MNAFLKFIGVINKDQRVHAVSFDRGVNVITGHSSTGKSALIEIFDYCFGCKEYNVPVGIITEKAELFFAVLRIADRDLVLARKPSSSKVFIRLHEGGFAFETIENISRGYFEDQHFVALSLFKDYLAGYLGLTVKYIDETQSPYSGSRKSPAPSIRSFVSFMLQHQNLVANKHAVFYRFDEKEKREQVIEHFDVFVGFADQTYFVKKKELEDLELQKRKIEIELPKLEQLYAETEAALEILLNDFAAITGVSLAIKSVKQAVKDPAKALEALSNYKLEIVPASDEHAKRRQALEDKKTELTAEIRKKHNLLRRVESSIKAAHAYTEGPATAVLPNDVSVTVSKCPFCNSLTRSVDAAGNQLVAAIEWLNEELAHVKYHVESFEKTAADVSEEIVTLSAKISAVDEQIASIDAVIKDLERHRSQYELALKKKVRIEAALEALMAKERHEYPDRLEQLNRDISAL